MYVRSDVCTYVVMYIGIRVAEKYSIAMYIAMYCM